MATTKKTKTVLTPVDERETFVSLQKTFADSESNTQEKLRTLYDIQQADNEIEKLVQLRGELPAEVAALEGEIEELNSKAAHYEQLIQEYTNNIENQNKQIVELDADIAKYRQQLDNISNSREFDSINKELENQDLLRQIAVKTIGECRQSIEEFKQSIEGISDKVSILQEDCTAKKEELAVIVESTATEEAKLLAARETLAAKLDERTLSAYDRIRSSVKNHLAVVTVFNGDSCGGCFNTITPQRLIDVASGTKLIICEHCGRIIVASPDGSED